MTTPPAAPELLPCPFCGSVKIVGRDDDGLFWQRCTGCGATGPETTKYSGEEGDPFTDWNTRADLARAPAVKDVEGAQTTAAEFCESWSLPQEAENELSEFIQEVFAAARAPADQKDAAAIRGALIGSQSILSLLYHRERSTISEQSLNDIYDTLCAVERAVKIIEFAARAPAPPEEK